MEIRSAEVGVELLPLLKMDLKVQKVALDGLQLNLIRKKDGKINWDNLVVKDLARKKQSETRLESNVANKSSALKNVAGDSTGIKDKSQATKRLLAGFGLEE